MSRTTLCMITAAGLAVFSLTAMIVRYQVMGDEVKLPKGPGTWKVRLVVQGQSAGGAKLTTDTPLDFGKQHIVRESFRSAELLQKPVEARHPERQQVLWSQRSGAANGPVRANYEFYCQVGVHRPTSSMSKVDRALYAPPRPGEYLDVESRAGFDSEEISTLARSLTEEIDRPADQAEALFHYVDREVLNEPSIGMPGVSAVDCLKEQAGDSGAKSRLLVALLRNRGIPARIVTGLTLSKGPEQQAHYWVESWIHDHWLPMCPFHHHYGKLPHTYLVFGFGDLPIVRGRHLNNLEYAFLVERTAPEDAVTPGESSTVRNILDVISLYSLPPAEQRLAEFLLLMPLAALIVCVFRNLVGLNSFGTFAPALVGLAFRDLHSLPGATVFVSILLLGWIMRRVLDHFHLLQVPRIAFMLSLVVAVLLLGLVAANLAHHQYIPETKYISLFPLVILTSMIERFWTLEVEDSTAASFKTLCGTMLIAGCIALFLSLHAVVNHMFRYPETLGLVMAVQLLIGRYTGYRLSELFRFRDFVVKQA